MLDASIFKAYDIRGVVDVTLTTEVVRAVGRVLGSMAREADVKATDDSRANVWPMR